MPKLDKAAHARALKLHQKALRDDPAYRKAWDQMVIAMFSELADAKLPDDVNQQEGKDA